MTKTNATDYQEKYRRLKRRHRRLQATIKFWLLGDYHFRFMADVRTYPSREKYVAAVEGSMRGTSTGQELLRALGGLQD